MSSPTKPFGNLSVSKTRSSDPKEQSSSAGDTQLQFPNPEKSLKGYNKGRLKEGLDFAHRYLNRRDISPRSEIFMNIYKDKVQLAMDLKSGSVRQDALRMVCAQEQLMHQEAFLKPVKKAREAQFEMALLSLRELQYFVRYGDYLKIIPTRLRTYAKKEKIVHYETICGEKFWTDIADDLRQEQRALEKEKRNEPVDEKESNNYEISLAFSAACQGLGISKELALWSVKEYGVRNSTVHKDIDDVIKAADFRRLAMILYNDREELALTFSQSKSQTDLKFLRTIIQNEIDKYFVTSYLPDKPLAWAPTQALIDCHMAASQPKPQQQTKDKGKKRVASTDVPRGSEAETNAMKIIKLVRQIAHLKSRCS